MSFPQNQTELVKLGLWSPFLNVTIVLLSFEHILQFDISGNFSSNNVRILWSKGDHRRIADSILAVDWEFEFDSRSLEACFSYFVQFMKTLIDRFVPIGTRAFLPTWMKSPPRR